MASSKKKPPTGPRGPKLGFKTGFALMKDSASAWSDDKASRLAAALSYYTIFSIAPLLVLAIAVAGMVFGQEAATNQLFFQIRGLVGDQGAEAIQTMVSSVHRSGGGVIATLVGLVTLLLGASGAFGQLQDALNTIWQVKPKPGQGIKGFLRTRILSFSMVLVIGFMLLVTLVLSAVLAGLGSYLERILPIPAAAIQALNFAISFGITALLFTLIYKVLPDVTCKWKDVWIGGVVTAFLFSLGRYLIGLYLGRGSVSSAYGAAGSLVIILLWIYYSSQILFFGAEFTKVYANTFGSHIKPSPHAEPVSTGERVQQGMEGESTASPVEAKPAAPKPSGATAAQPGRTTVPPPREPVTARHERAPGPLVRKQASSAGVRDGLETVKRPLMVLFAGTIGFLVIKKYRKPAGLADSIAGPARREGRLGMKDAISLAGNIAWLATRFRNRGRPA
ncbi:MAG: YihY/virulence factor BrkB family protein [Fibrobacteres bacterium]|nr:YihY/virulence factor BrkB family protein [Fibrobacterota bacterium]